MHRSALVFLALTPVACGVPFSGPSDDGRTIHVSGRVVTEERDVGGFSGIELSHVGRLHVVHGPAEALSVSVNEDLLPHLDLGVRGGVLQLGLRSGINVSGNIHLEYRVTARQLEELRVSGASTAEVRGVDARRFRVEISGASSVVAQGHADRQELLISGASSYAAEGLPTLMTRVTMSGASNAIVNVADLLEGSLSGASRVVYIGRPAVDVRTTGGSTVRPQG